MDNEQTLTKLSYNYLKNVNISISPANINILINKCNGDRQTLLNELNKIECLGMYGKKINSENLGKIINLAENFHATELVDQCLAKNKKKTINILNENNFKSEDCIIIIRTYLSKLKRLLKIKAEQIKKKDLEAAITSFKPPIFWKEKEIVKEQARKWDYIKIQDLIKKTNKIEFELKKNPSSSSIIIMNFIHENVA